MEEKIINIPLNYIQPHPNNRTVGGFDEKKLQDLADSINAIGVQQPAIVREYPEGEAPKEWDGVPVFQLVAGERRWRASRIAGQKTLPCIVRKITDEELLVIQTVENLQRENVHPLDEAAGFQELLKHPDKYDVKEIAAMVGRSEGYVRQRTKLNALIDEVRTEFIEGRLNYTYAFKIARLPESMQKAALQELKKGTYYFDWWIDHSRKNLSDVPFNITKKYGDLPPCSECKNRTGYEPWLFEDDNYSGKGDFCLDPKCLEKKIDLNLEDEKSFLRPWISSSYNSGDGACGRDEYEVWNEGEDQNKEEFEECLVVDGPERGKVILAKITIEDEDDDKDESQETKWNFKLKIDQTVKRLIYEEFSTAINDNEQFKKIRRIILESIAKILFYRYPGLTKKKHAIEDIGKVVNGLNDHDLQIFIFESAAEDILNRGDIDNRDAILSILQIDINVLKEKAIQEVAEEENTEPVEETEVASS